MATITSTEFQQNVGAYSDAAMREPVVITSHNRERLVLLSVDDYRRLKALDDRQALLASEMPVDLLRDLDESLSNMEHVEAADLPENDY